MESILQQLYEGKLSPLENYRPRIEAHKEARRKNLEAREDFKRELREADPALYEKFLRVVEAEGDCLAFETCEMFMDGFKLGAGMMLEILK